MDTTTNRGKELHMKQRVNLFLRHLLSSGPFTVGMAILIATLIINSLAACMEQRAQTASPTTQAGITPSPTHILQQAGPDSGLYIGSSIGTGANTDNAVYKID